CEVIYNKFVSAITQEVTKTRLIPAEVEETESDETETTANYEYEPEEEELLASVLPRNISTQIYNALLESSA
ncbi:MAG: F0F1 ATP synthase subunit gamma, partial [Candidatus Puniceispirillaceae bacterium]